MNYDVLVVGSGIAGMTLSIYLKRASLNVLIIENGTPGGALNRIWKIENYPGYKEIMGPDLAYNIYSQVNELDIPYCYDNIYKIDTDKCIINDNISYKYLVMATGRRPKCLNLENEDKYINKGISFCAFCDGSLYKDRDVVVVGGSNSAIMDTLYLSNICKSVTLVYRKDMLRGEDINIRKLDKNNINIIYNSNVKEYIGDDTKITGIVLDNGEKLLCDCVFLDIGSVPNSDIIDVKKDNGYIVVDNSYRTSISNVYAIGDVIKKDVYQLTTASGDATICAFDIINSIK